MLWLTPSVHAGEVFKCLDNGKTVFQGTPCSGLGTKVTVKPANGTVAPADSPTDAPPTAAQSSGNKLKASVTAMETERRQREINYDIRDLQADIDSYQRAMEREMAVLERKKSYANNNLAGATWEQSISTQMQAVAEKYRTRIQVAQDRIALLRRQSDDLAGKH